MSNYRQVHRASRAKELDRNTWASNTVVVGALDVLGYGEQAAHLVNFGIVFEGIPMFTYGAELIEGQTLVTGDFPFISVGVSSWETLNSETATANTYYTGAYVWVNVVSRAEYRIRIRTAFEGVAFKNAGRIG